MLNKAILMGRLTRDPELRTTPNGVSVASFTLAVDRNYARQGEQKQTDFLDIVCWRQTAEFVSKYFTKGQQVAVTGSIQTRKWQDKNGQNRVSVEIVADEVFFADSKREPGARPAGNFGYDAPAAGRTEAAPQNFGTPAFSSETTNFEDLSGDDDELPF